MKTTIKKYQKDLRITRRESLSTQHILLHLTDDNAPLPEMRPGQFVQILAEHSSDSLLRLPISINNVDRARNELWLLIHLIGNGTRALGRLQEGEYVNVVFPLGNGFTIPSSQKSQKILMVGGGVGVAPLLYLGKEAVKSKYTPTFLLGGKSAKDLLELALFKEISDVYVTTEDGTLGEKGFVTQHSIWDKERFDFICTCGPKPMMKAVARLAQNKNIECEVSLENLMACGLGACLCCVEKDADGHNVCVCKEGPVFSIKKLQWQI